MSINLINYALAKKDWKKAYDDLKVLEVGGRNLLSNSSQEFRIITLRQWGTYDQYELIWHKPLEELGLKNGDYITLSMYFDDVTEEKSVAMRFDFIREDNSYIISTGPRITKPGRYSITAKIPDNDEIVKLTIRLMPKDSQSNYGYQIKYKEAKLEKGNKATDWTPAPEDINAHPFVAELAESVFRSKQNEEIIRNLENAITALGGGS